MRARSNMGRPATVVAVTTLLACAAWLSSPAAAAGPARDRTAHAIGPAAAGTIVTIQFDDGNGDAFQAMDWLTTHEMVATFYINSGFIDTADHLTWDQVRTLAAAGNEIAGHTIDHADLKRLKPDEATAEVCGDRDAIAAQGLPQPVSFAYPFGSFDADTELIVASCGFTSGRGVSGVNDHKVFAETVPPLDAFATRTPPNPKKATKLSTLERYVTDAETHGGGWIQLVFHHICEKKCDAYSITSEKFIGLLDWLQVEVASGHVAVETTAQVIG